MPPPPDHADVSLLTTGTRLGPYEILAPLGRGGMGEVYRARDTRLNREIAVKVLPASLALDADRRARFEREAQAVAALSHPNILAIFDVGVASGVAFAVTELLKGRTLRECLETPLPVRKALELAVQIGRGLGAAHDKGIIHRDIKPENIFVLDDGQVKILDFGLAKAADARHAADETRALTDAGVLLGTVGYMAPEQVRGEPADARADLFSLGAVLYEMLAGRRAFQRDSAAETMSAILREDPPDLSTGRRDVPPGIDAIVHHCLERNPAERFQSARDLVFSLQSVLHGSGNAGTPLVETSTPRAPRLRSREAIAWLLVVALAGVLALAALKVRQEAGVPTQKIRFSVTPPPKLHFGFPLGAPDGSNGGTISPDGTMLAFVAGESNARPRLWVRPIDSAEARPLPGTEGAAFPFWSPDSRFIAFFTLARLRKIAVAGGPVETVAEVSSTARGGSWSQHGVILVATAGSPIFRVDAGGGALKGVTRPDSAHSGHQWPLFLPDGEHFLYFESSTRAIYVGSLDGSPPRRLGRSDTNAVFAPPSQILFAREGSLVAQDIDLTRFELTGEPRPLVQQVAWAVAPWNLGAFSVSKTGVLTYRAGGGTRTQFTWFDRQGRALGTVGPSGDYLAPALSPDGTTIAFTRRDDDPAGDIWTLDVARQTMSRVTLGPATDIYPVWAPDSSTIVFESTQDGLIARAASSTAAPRRLLALPSLLIPTQVLADGRSVLFFSDTGSTTGFDIFTVSLEGESKPVPRVQTQTSDVEPQLSPDGRWLAFVNTETGIYETFVQPFPSGSAKWQVPVPGGRQPMWRRDGRELFLVTSDRKFYSVPVRPSASTIEFGEPQFLFDMPANTVSVRNSYAVAPDGQRFLVNRLIDEDLRATSIDVIVNWQGGTR